MSDQPYQTLDSRLIWRSPWYALREDRVRFPDGSEGSYTVIAKRAAVWVLPILADGRVVLIRNYRYTVGTWLWEIPAGGIEPGASPEEAARIELAEEIGGQSGQLEQIALFYTMPGIGDELAHIFVARGVVLGEPRHEPSEVMERHIFSWDDVLSMVMRGEVADGPSALAILVCAAKINGS
jgi:ADP-ribose pyrophosphatase